MIEPDRRTLNPPKLLKLLAKFVALAFRAGAVCSSKKAPLTNSQKCDFIDESRKDKWVKTINLEDCSFLTMSKNCEFRGI